MLCDDCGIALSAYTQSNMKIPDYYEILGIAEDASLDEIKSAYRQMAQKCHPDHGGSHEQMLAINEAYEVLCNTELRREYDYARRHQDDIEAQAAAARSAAEARKDAENYPRKWSDFQREFIDTKYGKSGVWPTANSFSGWLFIIVGGLLGYYVVNTIYFPNGPAPIGIILGSAWLGRLLHQFIGMTMRTDANVAFKQSQKPAPKVQKPTADAQTILTCPHCSQKLRVPKVLHQVRITCSSCKHVFLHPPD